MRCIPLILVPLSVLWYFAIRQIQNFLTFCSYSLYIALYNIPVVREGANSIDNHLHSGGTDNSLQLFNECFLLRHEDGVRFVKLQRHHAILVPTARETIVAQSLEESGRGGGGGSEK